jgi:L-fucose mutarotase
MLKGIDPLLGPELLAILRAMGHGDEIVVADANFPSAALARKLVRADGIEAPRMLTAILSLMPLDDFASAAFCMAVVGKPGEVPPIVLEFQNVLRRNGEARVIEALERNAFYDRARGAFAIVATGETRLYGNLILKKGVIRPDAA